MRHDALAHLRSALLLAVGLGGCTPMPAADRSADGKRDPAGDGGGVKPEVKPEVQPEPAGKTGYVREDDGTVHRAGAQACSPANDRPACSTPIDKQRSQCSSDAECTAGPHPKCVQDTGMIGAFCRCDYACASDSDCKTGEVCACNDALGGGRQSQCVPAKCTSDAACDSGTCGLSVYFNGCTTDIQLACRTAADSCKSHADCKDGQVCAVDGSGAWSCQGMTCAIGRPLLVEGAARTAPTAQRSDWLADLELEVDVEPELAAALAERWTAVAALEHASVASFARFTLELLAHAAPPDLVADAQRAALDEIEHAKIAWALASLWADRPLGPGPLAMRDVVCVRDLEGMVAALVKEACVGETLGAAEACALADAAGHPTLSAVLESIAGDEQRHAALAWRTLRWLLATHGERVRVAALVAAAEAEAELRAESIDADGELVEPAWGLLGRDTLLASRREAFDEVVRPLLRATLGRPAAA